MADFDMTELDRFGVIRDVKGYKLPPEAWTLGQNVRFRDGGVEKLLGNDAIFGTPGVAPHFAMPVKDASQTWWLYMSLAKAYVYDGVSHTDITRSSGGDYSTSATKDINGTILAGVPIFNNGVDVPQYWAAYSAATPLAALSNWDANHLCKVMRAFGPFLVAINVTKSGTNFPHMVKWSHPADPGALPTSWDASDETVDAGEFELPDTESGLLMELLPLKGQMYLYKESSTWRMRPVAGRGIFAFDAFLETSGILSERCVALTGDGQRQFIATQDDIVVNDGLSATSILEKRFKKYLFNQIDTTNYRNCFCFPNPSYTEMWFCFPEVGQTNPNRALIWNYTNNALSEADVNFRNAMSGTVEEAAAVQWDSSPDTWATITGPWSESDRRRVVLCDPANTQFLRADSTELRDGATIAAILQREGMGFIGRNRYTQQPIVDFKRQKFINRLWLSMEGGPISVRLGVQTIPDGPVTWAATKTFDPATQLYLDFEVFGRAIAIEISSNANVGWRLEGLKYQVFPRGAF